MESVHKAVLLHEVVQALGLQVESRKSIKSKVENQSMEAGTSFGGLLGKHEAIPRDRGSLMSATARVGENFQQKIVRAPETLGSRSLKDNSAVVIGKEYEFELKM